MQAVCLITLLWLQLAFGNSDFNALLELKKGIKKDDSGLIFNTWKLKSVASDGCPQNWHGVTCNNGNIVAITLNNTGLVGEFDFRILSNLKLLQNLSISNNGLTGDILNVAEIESLENLDISLNNFHGLIPSTFTQLKNLVSVNLSSNNFEGILPSGFRNLKNLKTLDFHSNRFSGNVMNVVTELGGVVVLDLSCNQFVGSLDIGLGRASFVSSIEYLNVSRNALVGELFVHDRMPYFDSLEVFDASNNRLSGSVPSFNLVVSLRVLRLGSNLLSGVLPEALFQDSSVVISELDLSLNQLQGPVGSITSTSLRTLNLSSNQLSGSIPLKIGQCITIDLSNNNFSGNLSRIKYWGSYVESIDLSSNSLTGTFPNETSEFLRLSSFGLSNNSLLGILPPIISSYPELIQLDLSLNQLSGSIPPSLISSKKLISLNLSRNQFNGSITLQADSDKSTVSDGFSLISLDLSQNSLSGDFPTELSNFHNLLYLNVSYNNLSGNVPENLRKFPDEAFHPGNSLLISSDSSLSPDSSTRNHRRKNQVVIYFILAGIICGAIVLLLLFIICYRFYMKNRSENSPSGKIEGKDTKSGTSSLPSTPPSHKSVDPSLSTPSSGTKKGPTPENRAPLEQTRSQSEIMAQSPSKGQNLFGSVKSGSPDNCGDFQVFDGSLVFTAEELSRAPAEVIGRSCHGMLYRVTLENGSILVVKRLKGGIAKGKKEFAREARKLGNVRHPNLVSIEGYYCGVREHEKLIISNYVNSPCLGIYLQGPERSQIPHLSIPTRLKVSQDIAKCLDYLHTEKAIPHGNLKSTNILIDSSSNTLLTDYTLHRLLTPAGTTDQVLNSGALGYLPPEFINSSKPCPSLKSDIYAFGVILLELITGRSSAEIVKANQGSADLTDWVRLLVSENRAQECFGKVSENEGKVSDRMLRVALSCILPASERPDIRTVVNDLVSIERDYKVES